MSKTASEMGYVEENKFLKVEAGMTLEINGMPTFTTSKKFNAPEVAIPCVDGLHTSMSATVIGQLKSTNEKSVGQVLAKTLEQKQILKVFVKENLANTGRTGVTLSFFN